MLPFDKLSVFLLNAENLFILFDHEPDIPPDQIQKLSETEWQKLSSSLHDNKPLHKVTAIAKMITDKQPDIVMLVEVGGEESLRNFNRIFLESAYSCYLIEGNSDRAIDVGFLIKKQVPVYFDIYTNKNRPLNFLYPHEKQMLNAGYKLESNIESHRFSRDVAELHCFVSSREKPKLIFLLTHLKSPLDPDNIDPGGSERREAELKTLLEIFREIKAKYPTVPVMICGDFNGNASRHQTDAEFDEIYKTTTLEDVLELAQVPLEDRSTFYHVRSLGQAEGRQIDYCFLDDIFSQKLNKNSAQVLRFKNELGLSPKAPTSMAEKQNLPSDHYPIYFELSGLANSQKKPN